MNAVGIHVFAGGFTMGVKKVMPVTCQLEKHGFGLKTAEEVVGVPCINGKDWPDVDAQFAFGNPRCTGFSTITSGYDETTHGPWAKQTCDVHDLCNYAAGRYDVICWESVQQAYTTGRPLLDYLTHDVFAPKGYRIAHLFINAATFGNCQQRKRYFYVAYRGSKAFNITPPDIKLHYSVLYDAIWNLRDRETREQIKNSSDEYDFDTYIKLTDNEKASAEVLPNGWCLNALAKHATQDLPDAFYDKWIMRNSPMPFSLHCIHRANWLRPCSTIHSSSNRIIHPDLNRPLTVGEISHIMGWDGKIPLEASPIAQLAKGIVPAVGEWLTEQVVAYLNNDWGSDDFESTYNDKTCTWEGKDSTGQLQKTFDLTRYFGKQFDMARYELDVPQKHRLNICPKTGHVKVSWNEYNRKLKDANRDDNKSSLRSSA